MSHVEYHQDVCVRALGEDSRACFYSVTTTAVPPAQKAESQSVWHCHLCGATLVTVTSLSKEDIKATLKGDADKNGGKRAFHYRRVWLLPGRISVMPRNQFMAGEVWVCGHCPLSRVRWSV